MRKRKWGPYGKIKRKGEISMEKKVLKAVQCKKFVF